ncbi:hypothetical protein HJ49_005039 [Salmonella enterica subsp. enterica]|nr:hypothetical protein [Salmonella enterica]EDR7170191.1 hypothetical protein [Salmonella enterica subsp. houtenae]EDW0018550.1 hypothetical protein [Salmonella enterica subsp. enterica serovar Aba]EEJ5577724.1 hypothetical protein [Salmonella enterica subsp. enterica serovar Saintpaul]
MTISTPAQSCRQQYENHTHPTTKVSTCSDINTWPVNRVKELLPWNVTLSVN